MIFDWTGFPLAQHSWTEPVEQLILAAKQNLK